MLFLYLSNTYIYYFKCKKHKYTAAKKQSVRQRCNCDDVSSDEYLLKRHYLSSGLLELLQLAQEVPKSRFGYYSVRRKYPHFVQRRGLLLLGRELAPYYFEFLQLKKEEKMIILFEFIINRLD